MKLSILVPVYNEETTIKNVLTKLLSVRLPWNKEIIVVNDGSTDKTNVYLTVFKKKYANQIKIITHQVNLGKGKALQSGIKAATGDYMLVQDADLEYDPSEIKKLLQPLIKNKKDSQLAVYGSRFKTNDFIISPLYHLGNKFLTGLTNLLYNTNLTDMETGYKLLPLKFMKSIKLYAARFDIEPEITVKILKAKIPIIELPISYKGRSHLAGKKLTVTDAFAAVKILVSLRFTN